MNNYIWLCLLVLSLLCTATVCGYVIILKKRIEYLRRVLFTITSGTLFTESLSTVAWSYGLDPDELMTVIENYQNMENRRK